MNDAVSNAYKRTFEPLGVVKSEGIDGHLNTLLANSKAIFKVTTNTVAMHRLSADWRERLFKQIDSLLDADEWDENDKPIVSGSSQTFIRMLIFLNARRPGLGATSDGSLIATWTTGENRLTIICKPNDWVRWVVSTRTDSGCETAAGQTKIARLPIVLEAYSPQQWFSDGGR
ncbi:MAG: hypothetical protein EOS54_09490 [Mesorhizobium sp.]|uniref:hypothetical protein n=1 Tax=unclassified Mesorhizobium TaxID=325217 RepID=UPI000F756817|nr:MULTISPECIES: hypothetical protein [unclassified Mesorhizobium]AZO46918.1 hypothetical protein EJ073_03130 [Mesorhizobium sp. M4B.F.Ca.ET.058.02.1.1]RWC54895.1 MAG: hypothetical protein EOS54_09490 [Mesorhizobium sp.]TIU64052.1 MAG: hypothetical protein E5W30_03370 [Mesorhizobium sp.]TIU72015.1 MAG: hypothetical protein E5W25_02240 [Mesorhizobium sp.]TIV82130.1 MAG: hypothetical protein E5V64_13215 [Mesorhizobium sp.]